MDTTNASVQQLGWNRVTNSTTVPRAAAGLQKDMMKDEGAAEAKAQAGVEALQEGSRSEFLHSN